METIKVYHSLWKNGLLVAVCLGFTAIGIFLIISGKDSFLAWLGTLFFGIGGLFMLWLVLRERITHTPYYLITDDSIIMNSGLKTSEVHFADVECFFLTEVGTAGGKTKLIGIQYKENVELQKFEDAGKAGRAIRRFNVSVAGSQEALPADGLTINPNDLCEMLNERVKLLRNN
ncbi:MAG: hypothetical protein J6I61_11030 [Prevotella sp.]|nr:hypothetical protein [Prevotella sp.]